jgi:glycosyltransferase involved in cell wall biosynthesis
VMMPGKVLDVRPYLAGAIALVQASHREGLPRSSMEALSLEVPVIATDARGQRELVGEDGGQVVPIGAIDEMAAAMDQVVGDPDRRAHMGERGRQRMIDRHDIRLLLAKHERLYADLLADTSASASATG